jgi:hypothetical protein
MRTDFSHTQPEKNHNNMTCWKAFGWDDKNAPDQHKTKSVKLTAIAILNKDISQKTISTMQSFKRILYVFALSILMGISYGQEICNNGIDDDGDGFIDCYDIDCIAEANCEADYISDDVLCEVPPTPDPTFALKQQWASANRTSTSKASFAIGDLDGDGYPEVVTSNYQDKSLFILDGVTGATKAMRQVTSPLNPWNDMAIADINNDNCGEIFLIYRDDHANYGVNAFDCNLIELWKTQTSYNL